MKYVVLAMCCVILIGFVVPGLAGFGSFATMYTSIGEFGAKAQQYIVEPIGEFLSELVPDTAPHAYIASLYDLQHRYGSYVSDYGFLSNTAHVYGYKPLYIIENTTLNAYFRSEYDWADCIVVVHWTVSGFSSAPVFNGLTVFKKRNNFFSPVTYVERTISNATVDYNVLRFTIDLEGAARLFTFELEEVPSWI